MLISPAVRAKAFLLAVGFYGRPGIPDALTHRPLRGVLLAVLCGRLVQLGFDAHEAPEVQDFQNQAVRRVLQIVQGLCDSASELLTVAVNDPDKRRRVLCALYFL